MFGNVISEITQLIQKERPDYRSLKTNDIIFETLLTQYHYTFEELLLTAMSNQMYSMISKCMYCDKVRIGNHWQKISGSLLSALKTYQRRTDGVCPDHAKIKSSGLPPDWREKLREKLKKV